MPNLATDATMSTFDALYKSCQPAAVRAMLALPSYEARQEAAPTLVAEGYVIDEVIMVQGFDPYRETKWRLQSGYTWVPSAGAAPVMVAPGVVYGWTGFATYNPKMIPAGGIIVTLDMDLLPKLFPAPSAA